MTTIVGLVKDQAVYIGADSAGVSDIDCRVRYNRKVFRKRDMIIGYTGTTQISQILQYHWSLDSISQNYEALETISLQMVHLRTVLKAHGCVYTDPSEIFEGAFLVGYRSQLFAVYHDFSVSHLADDFDAMGAGSQYALGALYGNEQLPPKERLIQALQAAHHFHPGTTLPPYHIMELCDEFVKDHPAFFPSGQAAENQTN